MTCLFDLSLTRLLKLFNKMLVQFDFVIAIINVTDENDHSKL